MTLAFDGLGRTTSRVDEDGAERVTTTWTWDTAEHGIGKLHVLESPDGEKTYGYTEHGKLETVALRIDGERAALESRLGYDELGRVETLTCPTPAGAAPFVVAHDHDAHGHVLAVRDSATRSAPFVPPQPLTRGILTLESGAQVPLGSGWKGPAATMPKGRPGLDAFTGTHVEDHVAALMRTEVVSSATLYIYNTRIYPNCSKLLPDMLLPRSPRLRL
ncbi:hypothetical protein [Sorangium sp. So ce861]|uniref:hypothetical protein n=1 Tax=Sorangium sp. So ce861 TaxID=3133323 RepID=UPI003F644B6A